MAFLDEAGLTRVWAKIKAAFVAKETGKGLSDNNYTTAEKNKLAGIAAGANAYTHPTYTARTGKPTANAAPGFGDTVTISQITSDSTGHVTGANDRTLTIPDDVATDESDGLMSAEDKTKLDGIPSIVGVFARNIGDIEGELATAREEHAGIMEVLDSMSIQILNKPNLLKQNFWTTDNNRDIIYGNASQYTGSDTPYMKSISSNRIVEFDHEPTAEESEGAYRIYHRTAGEDSSGYTWTEAWIVSWVVDDSISTSCVTLTGDNIIHEEDGEDFTKAIQYDITANSAYGKMETLYYNQGVQQRTFPAGNPPSKISGDIEQMEVGKTYTVSCWARVISGGGAIMKFGWGGNYTNSIGYPSDRAGVSDWIDVQGAAWHRLYWTFVFAPEGDQYTETTADGKTTRNYNWEKRVIFAVGRKYTSVIQLAGFRLTQGGLYGNNTIDTLAAEVEAARDESAAATTAAQAATTAANKVMTGATASAAGAAGNVPAPAAGDQAKYLRGDGTWDDIRADILNAYPIKAVPVNGMGMLDPQASLSVSDAASGVPPYWIRLVITASSASTATITFTPMLFGTAATFTVDLTALNGGSALTQNTVVDIYDGVRMTISGGATVYLSEVIKTTEQYYTLSCDVANVGTYYRRNVTSVLDALERRIAALENA